MLNKQKCTVDKNDKGIESKVVIDKSLFNLKGFKDIQYLQYIILLV